MPTSTIQNPNSTPRGTDGAPQVRDTTPKNMLRMPKGKVAQQLQHMWDSQDRFFDKRFAVWKVNVLRHTGYRNVSLTKDGDRWDYYLPPQATPDNIPMLSELAEVIRKLTSIIFADPPAPIVEPAKWSDDEIYAAQIASRVLEDVDSESMLNDLAAQRHAFTKASDYGSGFIYYFVDPRGGPQGPLQIEAHPGAQHVDNALTHATTGAPLPPPYVKKYVREDGTLTDERSEAAMRDLPILKRRVLTGRNVRFIPHNSTDIWDSDGVLLGEFMTWGRLKDLFPELAKLPEDERERILAYRPSRAEDIRGWDQDLEAGSQNKDERLVWIMTAYFRKTHLYPEGARIIVVGGRKVLFRGKWSYERPDGTIEVMDIPLTQYKQWGEGRDDAYGVGTTEILGGADEFLASQFAMILDHLDRLNNRKIFVDIHSAFNEQDLYRRDKRIVKIHGDRPSYEEVPTVSRDVLAVFSETREKMSNAVGLGETTTGLESPSVKSGRHALAIVQQAQAALSEPRQNVERAYVRSGRIKLQLIRKHFRQPREAGWTTEDDEFRLDTWSRIDLGNSRDVRIKPGTMTMMTPIAKAQLAEHYFGLGILDQFKMYDIFQGNLGGTLGLEDDPVRLRIRRQIAEWNDGPPEGWTPPEPQEQVDPNTGQVVQVAPVDPTLEQIWQPVPADYMPAVAMVRVNELIRLMSSRKYSQKPQAWRGRVEQEFQQLVLAIQPPAPDQQGGTATPEQANQQGSPGEQLQAQDLAGLTDTANAPGQRPSPGTQ